VIQLTNNHELPEAILRAVRNDPYSSGDSDITVTRLIQPPQIRYLFEKHKEEIIEDVSERMWSLLGQAVHHVLERAGATDNAETEVRLYTESNGWKVSGEFDSYEKSTRHLSDYKITSVYSVMDDDHRLWEEQLNLLAELCRRNGRPVDRLSITAILRDWRRSEAARRADYPKQMVRVVPVQLWDERRAADYLSYRVMLHQKAAAGWIEPCTDDDRWFTGEQYAVMKKGAKRAIRLYPDLLSATKHADRERGLYTEHRPGEYKRCSTYCPVRDFCPQWAQSKGAF
jgi:hypothetical protein